MAEGLPVPECPNCHRSDKVEKVSDIVGEGFSTVPEEGAEPYPWAGQTYYIRYKKPPKNGSTGAKSQVKTPDGKIFTAKPVYNWEMQRERISKTALANRLLPNLEKPSPPGNFVRSMGCFSIFLWPFLIQKLLNRFYRTTRANYEQMLLKKDEAQEKWAKLYFCYRCQGVFTNDSGFVPAFEMNRVLFDLKPFSGPSKSARPDTPPPQKK